MKSSSALWFQMLSLLLIVLHTREAQGAANTPIVFGMSCPLNTSLTPAAEMGLRFSSGIRLAFDEANAKFGGVNGHPLVLSVLDDHYNLTVTTQNVQALIAQGAFAITGVVGDEQAQGAAYVCNATNVPLIGPYSGNYNLYQPFNRLFVNVRASYADEVNTLLSFLSNELSVTRAAMFYQNNSIQTFGMTNLALAFNRLGLQLVSQGVYDPYANVSAATIQPAVMNIYAGGTAMPESIVCIGNFAQIVVFIQIWRSLAFVGCTYCLDTTFVIGSLINPELLSAFMQLRGVSPLTTNGAPAVYVSQVVPFPDPSASQVKMVAEYAATRQSSNVSSYVTASFTELEGYLVGRMIVDTLFRMRSRDAGTWSSSPNFDTELLADRVALRQLFLETIYDVTKTFNIAGITLGPFSNTCNQGMRQVFMTALAGNYSYVPVPRGDSSFPGVCGSQTSDMARPLSFGQTADFTSADPSLVAGRVRSGIRAAFAGRNARRGGFNGRPMLLISLDDQSNSTKATANIYTLINDNSVFALMGIVGDDAARSGADLATSLVAPMIGPIAGAPDLRTPWIQNVINVRASVADETKHLVNYMTTSLHLVRVVALWSDDTTGAIGLQALNNSLRAMGIKLMAHASYPTDTSSIDQAFATINSTISSLAQTPQAIFLFGTQTPLTQFIEKAHASWPGAVLFATSSASADGLTSAMAAAGISVENLQMYMSSVVPYPWDTSIPIVAQYLSDMQAYGSPSDIGFSSLEGYIDAAFAGFVIDLLPDSTTLTRSSFIDAVYSTELVAFQGLRFGPFGASLCTPHTLACECNQGLHKTWMIKLNSSLSSYSWNALEDTLAWNTCTATSTCNSS